MITNLNTGKQYIGMTVRKGMAYDNYWGSGVYITNSIKKHGIENFEKELLQICFNKTELYEAERYWIEKMNTKFPNGYNIHEGGKGGDSLSMKSDEEKREIFRKRKENDPDFGFKAWRTRYANGITYTPEFRESARIHSYNTIHRPEIIQKRREKQRLQPSRLLKYTIKNVKTDEILEFVGADKLKEYLDCYNDDNNYKHKQRCNNLVLIYKGKSGDFIFIDKIDAFIDKRKRKPYTNRDKEI